MKGRRYTKTLQKVRYDLKKKKYTDRYTVPDDQLIVVTTMDMKLLCNCAECGRAVLYGDTWSSHVWYDESGVWSLPVCRACHEAEIKMELEARANDRKAT